MRLFNRFLILLALLGVAAAAQARPSGGVTGENCGGANLVAAASGPGALPRLSQALNKRFLLRPETGQQCIAFQNDLGAVTGIAFESNVELTTFDALSGSLLTDLRVNPTDRQFSFRSGELRTPVLALRIVGSSRRVWVVVRRVRSTPLAASQP